MNNEQNQQDAAESTPEERARIQHPASGTDSIGQTLWREGRGRMNDDHNAPIGSIYEQMGMPEIDEDDESSAWEETVGSSEPFDLDKLSDNQVVLMAEQGRGGSVVSARAERIKNNERQLQGVHSSTKRHAVEIESIKKQLDTTSGEDAARLRVRLEHLEGLMIQRSSQLDNLESQRPKSDI